jgi:hypothetical protein
MKLFTSQISDALSSDPFVSPVFLGVFACDQLPPSIAYPCAVVANTDSSDKSGEHWVAFYFDENGVGEYFDSYGLPPNNSDLFTFLVNNAMGYKCNTIQLQGLGSDVCGQYCIAFLANRCRGEPLHTVVSKLKGRNPGSKDALMARRVEKHYNIKKMQHGSGHDQCCCAKIECRLHKHLKCIEKKCIEKKKCKNQKNNKKQKTKNNKKQKNKKI